MTNLFCLDANVILKLLVKEEDSNLAEMIYTSKNASFISSNFAKYEIFSTIRKKAVRKEKNANEIRNALQDFDKLSVNFLSETDADIREAYDLAEKLDLPVIYDSLYLAKAIELNIPFVTADQKFLKLAKKVYKQAFSLKEVVGKLNQESRIKNQESRIKN